MFVQAVADFFRQSKNTVLGDFVENVGGWSVGFRTRPVVGGHFALLALDVMDRLRSGELGRVKEGVAVGLSWMSMAIGLVGLVLVAGVGWKWWARRRVPKRKARYEEVSPGDESPLLVRSGSPVVTREDEDD